LAINSEHRTQNAEHRREETGVRRREVKRRIGEAGPQRGGEPATTLPGIPRFRRVLLGLRERRLDGNCT
jgi:hypothetical protein